MKILYICISSYSLNLINNVADHNIDIIPRIDKINKTNHKILNQSTLVKNVGDQYNYIFPSIHDSEICDLANINSRNSLIGITRETADLIKTKSTYYSIFKLLHIPCPNYKLIKQPCNLFFNINNNYPCIVKPDNGAGSYGIKICDDVKSLKIFAINEQVKNSDYIIQDYIEGDICSIMGTVVNEEIQVDLFFDIESDCYPYATETGLVYPSKHKDLQSIVVKYLANFFKYIKLDNSTFTLDFIVTNNQIYFIDFGARLAINPLVLLWHSGNVNYISNLIDRIINKKYFNVSIDGAIMFRQKKNTFNKFDDEVIKNGFVVCKAKSRELLDYQYNLLS